MAFKETCPEWAEYRAMKKAMVDGAFVPASEYYGWFSEHGWIKGHIRGDIDLMLDDGGNHIGLWSYYGTGLVEWLELTRAHIQNGNPDAIEDVPEDKKDWVLSKFDEAIDHFKGTSE